MNISLSLFMLNRINLEKMWRESAAFNYFVLFFLGFHLSLLVILFTFLKQYLQPPFFVLAIAFRVASLFIDLDRLSVQTRPVSQPAILIELVP